jgi:RimJ/RimL family protein N-acetyltransferase
LKKTDRLIGGVGLDGNTGDESEEPALGYWPGEPYWGNGYTRVAVAVVIDYGMRTLGMATIRAYTDPSNRALQKTLLRCGLKKVSEIELTKPTRHGARHAPLFCILAADARTMNATVLQSRSGTLRLVLRRIRIIQCNAPFCRPGEGRDSSLP